MKGSMIQLVTFLGNPGAEYQRTRHNIAWLVADEFGKSYEINWINRFKGLYARQTINQKNVLLLKPATFMNKCGDSVQAISHFFKVTPAGILVLHDDIELDFGQVDVKNGGGLGGHNGLRSMTAALATRDFYRFRLGISRPLRGDVSSYVLSKFSPDEQAVLPTYLEKAAEVLAYCLAAGIEMALSQYSKKKLI